MSDRLKIGASEFVWGTRSYLMGVVNVTADSFSGDGLLRGGADGDFVERACDLALALEAQGADIIDIGGASSKPERVYGERAAVSVAAELERVVPVIEALRKRLRAPVSVDTCRAATARAALRSGASLINDVSMLVDAEMAATAAEFKRPIVITHNNAARRDSGDAVGAVVADLSAATDTARSVGVARAQIIVDPGIGFNKSAADNFQIIKGLAEIKARLNYPLLIGVSRKAFTALGRDIPFDKRLASGLAATALSVANGADIVRAHDAAETKLALEMADKIVRS